MRVAPTQSPVASPVPLSPRMPIMSAVPSVSEPTQPGHVVMPMAPAPAPTPPPMPTPVSVPMPMATPAPMPLLSAVACPPPPSGSLPMATWRSTQSMPGSPAITSRVGCAPTLAPMLLQASANGVVQLSRSIQNGSSLLSSHMVRSNSARGSILDTVSTVDGLSLTVGAADAIQAPPPGMQQPVQGFSSLSVLSAAGDHESGPSQAMTSSALEARAQVAMARGILAEHDAAPQAMRMLSHVEPVKHRSDGSQADSTPAGGSSVVSSSPFRVSPVRMATVWSQPIAERTRSPSSIVCMRPVATHSPPPLVRRHTVITSGSSDDQVQVLQHRLEEQRKVLEKLNEAVELQRQLAEQKVDVLMRKSSMQELRIAELERVVEKLTCLPSPMPEPQEPHAEPAPPPAPLEVRFEDTVEEVPPPQPRTAPAVASEPRWHDTDDDIDYALKAYFEEHTDFNVQFTKHGRGWYTFGAPIQQKVLIRMVGHQIVVRVGGGFEALRYFLEEKRLIYHEGAEAQVREAARQAQAQVREDGTVPTQTMPLTIDRTPMVLTRKQALELGEHPAPQHAQGSADGHSPSPGHRGGGPAVKKSVRGGGFSRSSPHR